jgi:hypothetical protein
MPSTSVNTVEDLIRDRVERSLESIASAGFCQEIATRIQLQEISVRGVELDGTDGDTVSSLVSLTLLRSAKT